MLKNSCLINHIISKDNKAHSYTKYKVKYDNNIFLKKMIEIKNKSGPYNIKVIRPNNDFGIQKSNYNEVKKIENEIKKEKNKKFKNRINNAKSNYSIKKMNKSNKKLNNYKNFLLKILKRNRKNPYIYEEMENILNF